MDKNNKQRVNNNVLHCLTGAHERLAKQASVGEVVANDGVPAAALNETVPHRTRVEPLSQHVVLFLTVLLELRQLPAAKIPQVGLPPAKLPSGRLVLLCVAHDREW